MAANEGITEAIASFYWGDSDMVFLDLSYDLRPNIIPANIFWVKCVKLHLVMTGISGNVLATSEDFWFSKHFRTLPKVSADVPKTFEHFRSYWEDDNCSMLWFR